MIGERLGKWVIFKELGRGGMGRVYLAQEEMNGRPGALKILAAELAQDAGFLSRFQQEIATLSQLDHPNIVRFYDSGFENGLYFYAMEYVEGQSLEDILQQQGRLPWSEVLDIALQICPALRHVHDHGIIHRDIKPPNILRTPAGQIKLTDFGIAKVFASGHLTATGGVVGTAEFLSPEQAAGKPVSKRSDLYSLGVVLYTLLTGRTPFEGLSFLDLLHKHRYAQFDRPQKVVPELPYEIDDVVCQLLEKDPSNRPPDCLVLGKHLESIRKKLDRKSSQTRAGAGGDATLAENRTAFTDDQAVAGPATLMSRLMRAELEGQKQQHPLLQVINRAWVLLGLLAICAGILVWTIWFRDDGPATEPPPAGPTTSGEAQRFFQQGQRLRHEGRLGEAKQIWQDVVQAFDGVAADQEWVTKAAKALAELEKPAPDKERLDRIRPALDRAAKLREAGKAKQADKIWSALENLYRHDPWMLQEIAKARKK